jgi:hypothetical protein
MPGISASPIVLAGDPYVAWFDPLNEVQRIEFSETWRNFEQLRGLRLVPNVLGGNGGAVLRFDPQRIEVRIYIRQDYYWLCLPFCDTHAARGDFPGAAMTMIAV